MAEFGLRQFVALEGLRSKMIAASLRPGSSIEDILLVCLDGLSNLLPYDVLSIYLLNRFGQMTRVAHRCPNEISISTATSIPCHEWQQFLGPRENTAYYEPLFLNSQEMPASEPLRLSCKNVGLDLSHVSRVPLNGSSQTFGMMEFVDCRYPDASKDEARNHPQLFIVVASAVASSVTLWRARNESFALADAVRVMARSDIQPDWNMTTLEEVFEEVMEAVLKRIQDYLVAILRIESEEENLRILAKSADPSISWEGWRLTLSAASSQVSRNSPWK